MSSSLIITLEFAGVVGVVFVFAIWQLVSVSRPPKKPPET